MAKKPASSKKPTKPAGKTLAQRLAASPALRKKYQSNPGLRSKYLKGDLEKYLTPQQKQKRALNVRLSAPIAPGSSVTERDLAHEAEAATTVRYGPQDRAIGQQLGVAQQVERDTGSIYDQYRAALQQHAASIQAYQAGAQQALAQTAQGITGLGSQEALQMQQSANQQAAQQGIAPAGDLSGLANAALAQRQALMGSFQNQQALTGAAVNQFADTQANVVAPGQKLSALAQARGRTRDIQQKQADLATEKGAYNQQFRQERRGEEFKNQLAMATLSNQSLTARANAAATTANAAANTPAAKAQQTETDAMTREAAKYGYTRHQWQMLGPKGRNRVIMAKSKTKGSGSDTVYTSGPFAGRTKSDVSAMSDSQRQKIVDDYRNNKGGSGSKTTDAKKFQDTYHVPMQSASKHSAGVDFVEAAQRQFKRVGTKVNGKVVTTDNVVDALTQGGPGIPRTPAIWVRVALEMARGGLTNGTAARLHKRGYSVSQLGLKMRSNKGPGKARTEHLP